MAPTQTPANDEAGPIPQGAHFAPLTPELLAAPGVTLAHVRVWSHVYLQTLGRPEWTLSHGQIARATGLGRKTVQRAVDLLQRHGWLTVQHRRDAAGDAAASLILCTFPEGVGVQMTTPPVTDDHTGGGLNDHTGGGLNDAHQKSHLPEESHPQDVAAADAAECSPAWFITDVAGDGYATMTDDLLDPLEMAGQVEALDPACWTEHWRNVVDSLPPIKRAAYLSDQTDLADWHRIEWDVSARALASYDRAHPWIEAEAA